ncbi:MAG: hypothetical protein KKB70_00660, partial [Proteobacteria bacterium]|nr:hypothetical protein [Pseudomonadota bacterium]
FVFAIFYDENGASATKLLSEEKDRLFQAVRSPPHSCALGSALVSLQRKVQTLTYRNTLRA